MDKWPKIPHRTINVQIREKIRAKAKAERVVINLTVARKAVAPKTDGVTGNGANRTMRRFMICTPRQIRVLYA